jgi:Flp pilus assembly protein TadD
LNVAVSQGKPARAWRVELLVGAALAVATLLVYCSAFDHPFVNYDDQAYVYQNPRVEAGLTADGVRWAFTTFACGNWHPLTWLSLQLDATLYGVQHPGGFHLTNMLLHAANAVLLFLVLGSMTGAVWRSAVVAALFALHPLHVESVAWVAERKDVLSTLFWVLTLAAYGHYVRRPGVGRYLLVVLALALGLLAKPMLVTLPCVLLLLDAWPLRRWPAVPFRRLLLEKVPLFALAAASCAVTVVAQLGANAVKPFASVPLPARAANAVLAYVAYLGQTFWPLRLAVLYPHPGAAVPAGRVLAAGALLVAVTALVLGPGRRRPYLAVGWLWFLGTLVPVIGLVQVGDQARADRYTYVPLIGVFLLLTWGAADLAAAWRLPRPALAAAVAVVLAACSALTWVQVGTWASSLTLWEHAAAVTENNAVAHLEAGKGYYEQGRLDAARQEFEAVSAIDPRLPEPHNLLGNVLRDLGRPREAVEEYRRAAALGPRAPLPHFSLGVMLAELGRPDEAAAEYRAAIDLAPASPLAHINLGLVLAELGRPEEAAEEFRQAVALDPGNAPVYIHLGSALQQAGRLDEARAEYRKAGELGFAPAWARLQDCERLRALRPRLAGVVAGREQPRDNAERLALADLCRQPFEGRYALATHLYAEAFAADPAAAGDVRTGHRLHAAVAAAAAGCGRGADAAGLDEGEKARLRGQALGWLREDLAQWAAHADDGPQARAAVRQVLRFWQHDAGLAGVRDPAALAGLPEAEREAWRKLWQEVEAVLARAGAAGQDKGAA